MISCISNMLFYKGFSDSHSYRKCYDLVLTLWHYSIEAYLQIGKRLNHTHIAEWKKNQISCVQIPGFSRLNSLPNPPFVRLDVSSYGHQTIPYYCSHKERKMHQTQPYIREMNGLKGKLNQTILCLQLNPARYFAISFPHSSVNICDLFTGC